MEALTGRNREGVAVSLFQITLPAVHTRLKVDLGR